MRGSPPIQALVLLLVLVTLAVAGKLFVGADGAVAVSGANRNDAAGRVADSSTGETSGEMELVFSSRPSSVTLRLLDETGAAAKAKVLFIKKEGVENPEFMEMTLPLHGAATYWLDIVWPNAPGEGANHMARVTITPAFGEVESYSFITESESLEETFVFGDGKNREKGAGNE